MATNYPGAIDELTNPSTDPDTPSYEDTLSHAAQHANANDAIEALETKVGKDSDTNTDSHDFKLSDVVSGDKAASQTGEETLTNKTLSSPTFNTYGGWIEAPDEWSYASADDPTFVITVPSGAASIYTLGMRIRVKQGGNYLYFIITKIADTALTVYGGTDYNLADAEITDAAYSSMKAPLGFPLDPDKWTAIAVDANTCAQATPTANTWYNIDNIQLSVPIGLWDLEYFTNGEIVRGNTTTSGCLRVTLSTSSSAESTAYMTASSYAAGAGNAVWVNWLPFTRHQIVSLAAKTTYYLLILGEETSLAWLYFRGDRGVTTIKARCAYL